MSVFPLAVLGDPRANLAPSRVEAHWVVAWVGDTSVEVLLPAGGGDLQLSWPGWSVVSGIDADRGSPNGDFTDDSGGEVTAWRRPDRLRIAEPGLISNLIGEAGHQLRPLRQILAPNRMIMQLCRNAGQPGKGPRVGRCQFCEAPVQHGGHVSCRV
jgi:hypothetical protein